MELGLQEKEDTFGHTSPSAKLSSFGAVLTTGP